MLHFLCRLYIIVNVMSGTLEGIMEEIFTGVINNVGLFKLVVTGQKENSIRISINGREQWLHEGEDFRILNDEWHVDKIYPVSYDSGRILTPNKIVAVLSPAGL